MTESPRRSQLGWLARWAPVSSLAALCVALACGGETLQLWGRYQREALEAGELWRLVTAHLVHLGWDHLWLNVVALGIVGLLFDELLSPLDWLAALLMSAASIDAGLYLLDRQVVWYVGLSGVLHGLVAAGALKLIAQRSALGAVLAAGVAGKLLWEQWMGPLPFSEATAGGPVVVEAHLYGALGGCLASLGAGVRRLIGARL